MNWSGQMTEAQERDLRSLCERYNADFDGQSWEFNPFDLPPGYVAGWIVRRDYTRAIYVGCAPEGGISS